jgi:hypothetical protein
MKTLAPLLCSLVLAVSAIGQDFQGPKPAASHLFRILLFVQGSSRAIDYIDVVKVHGCTPGGITFETYDGYIVVHQGPYTLIGPKSDLQGRKGVHEGGRFFDPK